MAEPRALYMYIASSHIHLDISVNGLASNRDLRARVATSGRGYGIVLPHDRDYRSSDWCRREVLRRCTHPLGGCRLAARAAEGRLERPGPLVRRLDWMIAEQTGIRREIVPAAFRDRKAGSRSAAAWLLAGLALVSPWSARAASPDSAYSFADGEF